MKLCSGLFLFVSACAGTATSGGGDLATSADLAIAVRDAAPVDLLNADGVVGPCTLGTPDHCGTCGTSCPPGMDTDGTERTCSLPTAFGVCDFLCKGEYYDVDGKASNGCEAQDLPIQDSTLTAVVVNLPNAFNTDLGVTGNPSNIASQVYGDNRVHATAPSARPNGREDWYQLDVTGGGSGSNGVTACLGITNFPADNMFEVCLSASATFQDADCLPVMGAAPSVCKTLAQAADETGTYYARVSRISGTWSALQYALFLEH